MSNMMTLDHHTPLTLRCPPKAGLEGFVAAVWLCPDGRSARDQEKWIPVFRPIARPFWDLIAFIRSDYRSERIAIRGRCAATSA
jgi:hypothetical protein